MPHTDGPAFYPLVSTITLGSHGLLDLYEPLDEARPTPLEARHKGSMLLQRRSLVLITDTVYKEMLHGIRVGKFEIYV